MSSTSASKPPTSVPPPSATAPGGDRPSAAALGDDRHARLILATVMAGAFIALLDTTIVNVALPSLQHALHAGYSSLSWTVSGYALAFGLMLIPAGRMGDAIGRKPLYVGGLILFLVSSLAAGLSQTIDQLVVARIVQGIGAGIYYTQISATIVDTFHGPVRAKAFGVLAAVIGLSTATGPLAGGLLIAIGGSGSGWRWVFLVNLVIGAVAVPAAIRLLPKGVRRPRERADVGGGLLLALALMLILYPLIEGQSHGWPLWAYLCLAASVPVLGLLAVRELRVERAGRTPLIPPHVVRHASFSAGASFGLVYFASFTSIFFTLSVVWQEGLGHSALAAGLVLSPFAIGGMTTAARSAEVAARLGRRTLTLGCAIVTVGFTGVLLVFHWAGPRPSAWRVAVPLLVAGLGNGLVVAPNVAVTLSRVPRADNGAASGVLNTAQRVGSALGIALVATVLFGTLDVGHGHDALAAAFSHSFQIAMLVNIGLVVIASVLVLGQPRDVSPGGPPSAPPAEGA